MRRPFSRMGLAATSASCRALRLAILALCRSAAGSMFVLARDGGLAGFSWRVQIGGGENAVQRVCRRLSVIFHPSADTNKRRFLRNLSRNAPENRPERRPSHAYSPACIGRQV